MPSRQHRPHRLHRHPNRPGWHCRGDRPCGACSTSDGAPRRLLEEGVGPRVVLENGNRVAARDGPARAGTVIEQPHFFRRSVLVFLAHGIGVTRRMHVHARANGTRAHTASRTAESNPRTPGGCPHTDTLRRGPASEPGVGVLGVRRSFGRYRSDPGSSAQPPAQSTALRPPIATFGAAHRQQNLLSVRAARLTAYGPLKTS